VPGLADVTFAASGTVSVEQVTDGQGQASFGVVPAGSYQLTAVPPSELGSTAAITTVPLAVTAAGTSTTITLAHKVTLSGTLAPLPAAAGATVTALDKSAGATGTTVSARAGTDGGYSLLVDPGRDYGLVIKPGAGQPLGRALLRPVSVCKNGLALGKTIVPRGLPFTGIVYGDGGARIGGAFIQVFCVASAPACGDPTVPLAEATTRGDGTFAVTLPDLTAGSVTTPAACPAL
jgi:hypothetical protein